MPVTAPSMYCKTCRYVLDGLDVHRCPECGRKFDPKDPCTFDDRPRRRWRLPNAAAFARGAFFGALAAGIVFVSYRVMPRCVVDFVDSSPITLLLGPLALLPYDLRFPTFTQWAVMFLSLYGVYGMAWRIAKQIRMTVPLAAGIAAVHIASSLLWTIQRW